MVGAAAGGQGDKAIRDAPAQFGKTASFPFQRVSNPRLLFPRQYILVREHRTRKLVWDSTPESHTINPKPRISYAGALYQTDIHHDPTSWPRGVGLDRGHDDNL